MACEIIWWITFSTLVVCIIALLIQLGVVNKEIKELSSTYATLTKWEDNLKEEDYRQKKRADFLDESIDKVKKMHDDIKLKE